jgi:XTP/dITP diphosphohydrolase
MHLLIATSNPAKLKDYKDFAQGLPLKIVSLKDLGVTEEFDEVHRTFEENAKGKAEFYQRLTNLPTLADDSGIEIPFYNMGPGVKTKHWDGRGLNDEQYLKFIVEKIKAIPPENRQAQMRAVLGYSDGKRTILQEGIIAGRLTDKIYRDGASHGYPWDQVFIVGDLNKYYEELTFEENRQHNHRAIAFDKLKKYFTQ